MEFSNPFDNPQGQFYILQNPQRQFSLWPQQCSLPAGWTVACLDCPDGLDCCRASYAPVFSLIRSRRIP